MSSIVKIFTGGRLKRFGTMLSGVNIDLGLSLYAVDMRNFSEKRGVYEIGNSSLDLGLFLSSFDSNCTKLTVSLNSLVKVESYTNGIKQDIFLVPYFKRASSLLQNSLSNGLEFAEWEPLEILDDDDKLHKWVSERTNYLSQIRELFDKLEIEYRSQRRM